MCLEKYTLQANPMSQTLLISLSYEKGTHILTTPLNNKDLIVSFACMLITMSKLLVPRLLPGQFSVIVSKTNSFQNI